MEPKGLMFIDQHIPEINDRNLQGFNVYRSTYLGDQ